MALDPTPPAPHAGGCLCGAVRYATTGALTSVTYCHCSMCRRWHGHAGAYYAVDREALVWQGAQHLAWYASTPEVKRGFCRDCGSSIAFDDMRLPKMALTAGSLDMPSGVREKAHIFVASKGDYYEIADELLRFAGDPHAPDGS